MRQLYNVCVCAVVDPQYLDAMTMDDVCACRCVLLQIDAQLALHQFPQAGASDPRYIQETMQHDD